MFRIGELFPGFGWLGSSHRHEPVSVRLQPQLEQQQLLQQLQSGRRRGTRKSNSLIYRNKRSDNNFSLQSFFSENKPKSCKYGVISN